MARSLAPPGLRRIQWGRKRWGTISLLLRQAVNLAASDTLKGSDPLKSEERPPRERMTGLLDPQSFPWKVQKQRGRGAAPMPAPMTPSSVKDVKNGFFAL